MRPSAQNQGEEFSKRRDGSTKSLRGQTHRALKKPGQSSGNVVRAAAWAGARAALCGALRVVGGAAILSSVVGHR